MIDSIEYVYSMYTTATAQLLCLYIVLAFGVRRSSAAPAARSFCKRISCMEGGTSGLDPMTLFQLIIYISIFFEYSSHCLLFSCSIFRISREQQH